MPTVPVELLGKLIKLAVSKARHYSHLISFLSGGNATAFGTALGYLTAFQTVRWCVKGPMMFFEKIAADARKEREAERLVQLKGESQNVYPALFSSFTVQAFIGSE